MLSPFSGRPCSRCWAHIVTLRTGKRGKEVLADLLLN
ncbi:hypothetical protein KWI12_19745 [Citrobacter cronae]|nr:hypothetical protein [Citrobacter cronae]